VQENLRKELATIKSLGDSAIEKKWAVMGDDGRAIFIRMWAAPDMKAWKCMWSIQSKTANQNVCSYCTVPSCQAANQLGKEWPSRPEWDGTGDKPEGAIESIWSAIPSHRWRFCRLHLSCRVGEALLRAVAKELWGWSSNSDKATQAQGVVAKSNFLRFLNINLKLNGGEF
jgi:hypothetical protein